MTLTISVPADAESALRLRADAAGQGLPQFVERLLKEAIPDVSVLPGSDADTAALDAEYERGYRDFPEDASLVAAMMPHLAIEPETWE